MVREAARNEGLIPFARSIHNVPGIGKIRNSGLADTAYAAISRAVDGFTSDPQTVLLAAKHGARMIIDYMNGQTLEVIADSYGILLTMAAFKILNNIGLNPVAFGVQVHAYGSPASAAQIARIVGSENLQVTSNPLDPVVNAFSMPWNPIRTGFGLLELMTIKPIIFHDANH